MGIITQSNFKPVEFDGFRTQAGANAFTMSPTKWIEGVNAIGIVSKSEDMVAHMLIQILHLSLHHGYLLNSNYTLSRIINASRVMKTAGFHLIGT